MPPKKAGSSKPAASSSEPAHEFKTGDTVLCKVKGYPEWPGRLVDPESASDVVAKSKGVKKFLVKFYPDADYHWAILKEMKYLSPKDIDAYLSDTKKKGGKLRKSYEIAKDPAEWEEEIKTKGSAAVAEDDDDEDEDVDMLDEDGEPKAKSKKRKRTTEKKEPAPKKEKKEPAAKKQKAETKKYSKAASKDKKASTSAPKSGEESDGEKTAKGWRASLQKAFLTKGTPDGDKMPEYDQILTNMEKFDMQAEWLASSKLGKVLKRMSALTDIARDDEFKISERSGALVEKWKELMAKEGEEPQTGDATVGDITMLPADDEKKGEETAETKETNGDHAETKMDEDQAEAQTNGADA